MSFFFFHLGLNFFFTPNQFLGWGIELLKPKTLQGEKKTMVGEALP